VIMGYHGDVDGREVGGVAWHRCVAFGTDAADGLWDVRVGVCVGVCVWCVYY